jgi:hypothetical protein
MALRLMNSSDGFLSTAGCALAFSLRPESTLPVVLVLTEKPSIVEMLLQNCFLPTLSESGVWPYLMVVLTMFSLFTFLSASSLIDVAHWFGSCWKVFAPPFLVLRTVGLFGLGFVFFCQFALHEILELLHTALSSFPRTLMLWVVFFSVCFVYACGEGAISVSVPTSSVRLSLFVFLSHYVMSCSAVCHHCYGQLTECTGDPLLCPFVALPAANAVLSVAVAATAGGYAITNLLPQLYLKVLTRPVLTSVLALTRHRTPGTVVDVTGKGLPELQTLFSNGGASKESVMSELSSLIPGSNAEEQGKIKLLLQCMKMQYDISRDLCGASKHAAWDAHNHTIGLMVFVWALAAKVVRRPVLNATLAVERDAGDASTARLSEKLLYARTAVELCETISVFITFASVLGVANHLLLVEFFHETAYQNLANDDLWQFVYCLIIEHLTEIDNNKTTTFGNIGKMGSADTRRNRARKQTEDIFGKNIFRLDTKAASPTGNGKGIEYSGKATPTAKSVCVAWNTNKDHKSEHLHSNGVCKFRHGICDSFVSDKGPGGTCGGEHKRVDCDNAAKCKKALV